MANVDYWACISGTPPYSGVGHRERFTDLSIFFTKQTGHRFRIESQGGRYFVKRALFCSLAIVFSSCSCALAIEYRFTNIADSSTPAPYGLFESFGLPAISGDTVAFRGRYLDSEESDESGIFTGSGQALVTVAKTGDAAPLGVYGSEFSDPAISGASVAFRGSDAGGSGIFVGDGVTSSAVAQVGDPVPPGNLSTQFGSPSISDGTVAFSASYSNDKKGILTASAGSFATVVTTGDAAPTGTFGFNLPFGDPSISGNSAAFRGAYPGGSGIFRSEGGTLTTIVKTGDPAPDGDFSAVGSPSVSGGVVAFFGSYTGGGGVFKESGGFLTAIAKTGDVTSWGTLTAFEGNSVAIADGQVALVGYNDVGQHAVLISINSELSPVLKSGDVLFGSTVVGLSLGRFGLDAAGSGNLTFLYELSDGRFGIAIAHSVPEPNVLMLLAVAIIVAALRTRIRM